MFFLGSTCELCHELHVSTFLYGARREVAIVRGRSAVGGVSRMFMDDENNGPRINARGDL